MKVAALFCLLLAASAVVTSYALGSKTTGAVAAYSYNARIDANGLYDRKCSGCHGKDGHGLPAWRSLGQPDFADSNWQHSVSDAQLTASIENGKGDYMPSWKGKLSDAEIKAMVAKVRAFAKK